jgi:hypothetical protein
MCAGRPGAYNAGVVPETEAEMMFELIREIGGLIDGLQAWFLAQPLPVKILTGAAAIAVLWVLWIVLRVLLVAFRAAFRGL